MKNIDIDGALSRRGFLRRAGGAVALSACGGWWAGAEGARPNIVLIMADDMGFSDIGCYGGEIATPHLDRLAAGGMRFTQFYNNAKCAPTRASLLTGLYSQQCGVHDGPVRMRHCATLAEVLRGAGYRTLMTGKWHADELPTERGFDRYYGLADGCCNYFNPGVRREGEAPPAEKNYPRKWAIGGEVRRPYTPEDRDFYATDAFADEAVAFLDEEGGDRPFFLYTAFTAPHYPLHARPADIAKYRGKYTIGWDVLRAQRHERMLSMGIMDKRWPLAPRDPLIPAWDDIERRAAWPDAAFSKGREGLTWEQARDRDLWDLKMAVYAAMVDRMDHNIGRILAKIEDMGQKDNTLVLFLSDNGGCAETRHTTPDVPPGPVDSYRTVDPPWACAQNTPFRKFKRWDHEGGISTPLIAHWPERIAPGAITHQPGHLIDIMPTLLEISGARYPESREGEAVLPFEGKSLVPVLEGGERTPHETLCWQFLDCRAIRRGKWKLVCPVGGPWELYDLEADRTELYNRAEDEPALVRELDAAWNAWAARCGALPHPAV